MKQYIPMSAFCLFLFRLLYTGASIGDALALLTLAALYGWYLYLEAKTPIEDYSKLSKEIDQLKGNINSLKMGATLRR